ncbi:hypothetical protein G7Y89_g11295 [Cudoniella acicularis]|uniref:Uncharacterized protein n=1 Tax=Cudoniella acicularis TaxID=354080 RepID=A0A8H4RDH2_9HELO|nr:hypothetical protein G7Y89_g11295 [Cudoniella acicularis]
MSYKEKHHENMIILIDILPEFAFISRYGMKLFASDEITRGLSEMVRTKHIETWVIFATKIFLDIHHLLRQNVDRAFTELQYVGKHAVHTLTRYFEFSQGLTRPSTWPESNDKIGSSLNEGFKKFILKDAMFPLKVDHNQTLRQPPPAESERFYLLKRHPIFCGILAFRTILEVNYFGNSVANACGSIIYPAHLYNALRQKDNPIKPWPLMDQAIAIHTEERVFVGSAPKSLADCSKQVSLMLGYSVEQFARNRRQNGPIISKKGPRGLKKTSVLGEFYREGLATNGGMAITIHNVEELLNEQAMDSELASKPNSKSARRAWAATRRLTPLQLLEALRDYLPIELGKLKFDYFRLHEQSIQMLRTIVIEMDQDFLKYLGQGYLENESQLPFIAPYVIMIATQTIRGAEHLKVPNAGSKVLEKAGRVVEEFIEKEQQNA